MLKSSWLLVMILLSMPVGAMENEPFQLRTGFVDMTDELNQKFNDVLKKISEDHLKCGGDEREETTQIFERVLSDLGGWGVSRIERWLADSPRTQAVPLEDSLYLGWSQPKFYFFSVMGRLFPVFKPCCAKVALINNALVASDKIGHFVHTGYQVYFEADLKKRGYRNSSDFITRLVDQYDNYHIKNAGVAAVFELSDQMEEKSYGLQTTGIYSFADIVSNYEGYLFWSHLVESETPYFKCISSHWEKVNDFDWKSYVNPGWDEAINCNRYTESMAALVENNIREKFLKGNKTNFQCPVDVEACKALNKKYGNFAHYLLHPACAGPKPSPPTL